MLPKTGTSLQQGLTVHYDSAAYAAIIATALHDELGETHRAVKTIRRWTGAGERTVTNWLAAENGPSGPHLAMLAHCSDAVLEAFLVMAGRERVMIELNVAHVREELITALTAIDRLVDMGASGDWPN
jgi:hypothetical protein